jgi:hypothetical protein
MAVAVFGVYRSPRTCVADTEAMFQHIRDTAARYNTPHLVVMGDFNIDWLQQYDANLRRLREQLLQPLQLHVTSTEPTTSYKLQVLRIRSKAVACLSLRSSVRKLRKGVNEPRLTSQ